MEDKFSNDKQLIDQLTNSFFSVFTNTNNQQPDWSLIQTLCIPESIIIKKSIAGEEIYNLQSFIEPRKKILSDGTLTEFEEHETQEETKIAGSIAQRISVYEKSGCFNGIQFHQSGTKLFQLIKTNNGWKINSLIWEDD